MPSTRSPWTKSRGSSMTTRGWTPRTMRYGTTRGSMMTTISINIPTTPRIKEAIRERLGIENEPTNEQIRAWVEQDTQERLRLIVTGDEVSRRKLDIEAEVAAEIAGESSV